MGFALLALSGICRAGRLRGHPTRRSRRAIAGLLASQGVVRSRWVFEALSRRDSRRTLQAGEYFFDQPATAFDVFDTLAEGRVYVRDW